MRRARVTALALALLPGCGDSEAMTTDASTTEETAATTAGPTAGSQGSDSSNPTTDAPTTDPTDPTDPSAPTTSEPTTTETSEPTTETTNETSEPTTEPTSEPTDPTTTDTDTETTGDPFLCPDDAPVVTLPRQGITAAELGVLVNLDDPQSVAVADYYVSARQIPAENVVELSFPVNNVMTEDVFNGVAAEVDAALGPEIQALALTWTRPYRVGCMAATAAFALGFDTKYCNTSGMGCGETAFVDYFNSESTTPYDDHGLRPAMMLAAKTVEFAEALIDRGVSSDGTFPGGDGYFLRTTDVARSVRWPAFVATVDAWDYPEGLALTYLDNSMGNGSNVIEGTQDVLFYFTGLATVGEIDTNTYVPGAVADHLTSYGGQVPDSGQMSVCRWLEAGVTASFGTVVEPCNYPTKFPDTTVLLPHYFRGDTIVEAYWKSVAWPGEGNFVGEPLASPWGASPVTYEDCALTIETTLLRPFASYELQEADAPDGPWTPVLSDISIDKHLRTTIEYEPVAAPYYQLVRVQ